MSSVIHHPLVTEKAMDEMDFQNKLQFIVDVATAREVNTEDLAPGAAPGRLTVFTESALAEVGER